MSIGIEGLTKRFGGVLVVDRVTLEVDDRELLVLLGTSGSGKSTVLRMVAGLTLPDAGVIRLHGKDVTALPPQARGTGFVFQNYSIFRHMTVAENIEFGLKIRKRPREERARRRDELLDLVGLGGFGLRYASELSGGQRQRVALARALAYEPGVLLLDEPFGALDVKTRAQLRRSLKQVQAEVGVTTVLVTHDQEEAFELGHRIGVLDRGRLLEVAGPEELYRRPRTAFAATFVGAGTLLRGRAAEGRAHVGPLVLPIPRESPHEEGVAVRVLVRPEQVALHETEPGPGEIVLGRGVVIEQSFSGASRRLRLALPRPPGVRQFAPLPPFGEERLLVDALVPSDADVAAEPWVTVRGWHVLAQPETRLLVVDSRTSPARARAEGAKAGRDETTALGLAVLLAPKMQARVTIVATTEDEEGVAARSTKLLEELAGTGLDRFDARVQVGELAGAVAAVSRESHYAAVVVAPEARALPAPSRLGDRRRTARFTRLGPTVERLLERGEVPVLVPAPEPKDIARILICTAAGEPGKHNVRVGGFFARRLGAPVTLLHVCTTPEPGRLERKHLEAAARTLRALEVEVAVRFRSGRVAAQAILDEIREGAFDLVVVGRHNPDFRAMFPRHNVTEQVLAQSMAAALVVPWEAGS